VFCRAATTYHRVRLRPKRQCPSHCPVRVCTCCISVGESLKTRLADPVQAPAAAAAATAAVAAEPAGVLCDTAARAHLLGLSVRVALYNRQPVAVEACAREFVSVCKRQLSCAPLPMQKQHIKAPSLDRIANHHAEIPSLCTKSRYLTTTA